MKTQFNIASGFDYRGQTAYSKYYANLKTSRKIEDVLLSEFTGRQTVYHSKLESPDNFFVNDVNTRVLQIGKTIYWCYSENQPFVELA